MAKIEVETEEGPIWFWGEDRGLPLVLVVTGFRSGAEVWSPIARPVGLDYLRVHLPGNHAPPLREVSVAAYSRALDAALASRFAGRPLMVAGLSVGALVALGLRRPELRRLLLLEPPLRTHALWPLRAVLNPSQGASEIELAQLWSLFGIAPRLTQGRDYRGLLNELSVPTRVLLGDLPLLPPRDLGRLPSLVDEESRAALDAHPLVRVSRVVGGGHGIQFEAARECFAVLVDEARIAFDDPTLTFAHGDAPGAPASSPPA